MRRLPLAYSCDRRWSEMDGGGDVVRRCEDCGHDVVNLSALDELTARSLLEQQTAPACVRYRYERGRIVFARARRGLAMAAAAAVLLAAAPSIADTSAPPPPPPPRRRETKPDKKRHEAPAPKKAHDPSEDDGIILPPKF
jgi:hypothetical protein